MHTEFAMSSKSSNGFSCTGSVFCSIIVASSGASILLCCEQAWEYYTADGNEDQRALKHLMTISIFLFPFLSSKKASDLHRLLFHEVF